MDVEFHVPFEAISGDRIDFDQVEVKPLRYSFDFTPGSKPG